MPCPGPLQRLLDLRDRHQQDPSRLEHAVRSFQEVRLGGADAAFDRADEVLADVQAGGEFLLEEAGRLAEGFDLFAQGAEQVGRAVRLHRAFGAFFAV